MCSIRNGWHNTLLVCDFDYMEPLVDSSGALLRVEMERGGSNRKMGLSPPPLYFRSPFDGRECHHSPDP